MNACEGTTGTEGFDSWGDFFYVTCDKCGRRWTEAEMERLDATITRLPAHEVLGVGARDYGEDGT